MNINDYLNRLVPPTDLNLSAKKKAWVYSDKRVDYKKPSFFHSQKLEKILSVIGDDFDRFSSQQQTADPEKLAKLKQIVQERVTRYHKAHSGLLGKIYLLISRFVYGDIDQLSQKVMQKIDGVAQNPLAQKVINTFKSDLPRVMQDNPDFEAVQRLKAAKKEAKKILQDQTATPITKKQMETVLRQYEGLVQTVRIMGVLREISQKLRKPDMIEDSEGRMIPKPYAKLPFSELLDRIIFKMGAPDDAGLYAAYLTDKTEWKKHWLAISKELWHTSIEAQNFLKQNKKITFITGSQSASIPSILKIQKLAPALSSKPALVPTGQLLKHNLVPYTGELEMGITEHGVNTVALSGMKFAGLDQCVGYATNKTFHFDSSKELKFINEVLQGEDSFAFDIPRLRVAVLRLLLMGACKEEYDKIKQGIRTFQNQFPPSPINNNWRSDARVIGLECQIKGVTPASPLSRGKIVSIPRLGPPSPTFGMIVHKYEDGSYEVLLDNNGSTGTFTSEQIKILPRAEFHRAVIEKGKEINEEMMEKLLKNDRDKLDDILQLFDTVNPIEFSPDERELIEYPFPIVWASISLEGEEFGRGVRGEHIIRGKAYLGEDIQLVFTDEENVDKLSSLIKDYGIEVLSFEAAYYILNIDKKTKYQDL